ncbi:hypothetical protein O181_018452 [Austropuccinia psidii MF-1]|uniref:Uncharacterized protein n=1 Tax=Austropuccinia psidii MF-1 TaxID=1389203 RepID=A0A9Q3GTJ0_9BASI|nr:hypothetical protein [Austropuccinia psidii MF-1]
MRTRIPLTTPIASSMNLSGLNIDVGNATTQTQALGQYQIFLPLPFPQIPLIHKHMCLRDHEAHQKFHQRLIRNPNFHVNSSLILWSPRNPLGKVSSRFSILHQDLRLMWAMKNGLMIWHLKARQSGLRSQWKIMTKVTECHDPYASKPRMGHASSSREKMVGDRDENMSLTQSETNDEPRRHEDGT